MQFPDDLRDLSYMDADPYQTRKRPRMKGSGREMKNTDV